MLRDFASYITYNLMSLKHGSRLVDALNFFIYGTTKIFLLLTIIIFIISIIRSYFSTEKTKHIISHKNKFIGNMLTALIGVVVPICSCLAVPLFIGFVEGRVPLGVTFSFLISSLGTEAKGEKVSDIQEIIKFTMPTPGLVLNGKLKHSGKPLPTLEKVKELIKVIER